MQRALDNDLEDFEHVALTKHLLACPTCAAKYERLKQLSLDLQQLPKISPPFSIVDSIMPRLEQIDQDLEPPAEPILQAVGPRSEQKPGKTAGRRIRGSRLYPLLAVAAAACIMLVLFINNMGSGSKQADEMLLNKSGTSDKQASGDKQASKDSGSKDLNDQAAVSPNAGDAAFGKSNEAQSEERTKSGTKAPQVSTAPVPDGVPNGIVGHNDVNFTFSLPEDNDSAAPERSQKDRNLSQDAATSNVTEDSADSSQDKETMNAATAPSDKSENLKEHSATASDDRTKQAAPSGASSNAAPQSAPPVMGITAAPSTTGNGIRNNAITAQPAAERHYDSPDGKYYAIVENQTLLIKDNLNAVVFASGNQMDAGATFDKIEWSDDSMLLRYEVNTDHGYYKYKVDMKALTETSDK